MNLFYPKLGNLLLMLHVQLNNWMCLTNTSMSELEYWIKSLRRKSSFSYLGSSFESGVVSIFMQYAAGGSLDSILRKFGPLGESISARYTLQLLNAVAYLHDLHIVHRWGLTTSPLALCILLNLYFYAGLKSVF